MIYLNKKAKKKKNLLLQFMSWCWYKVIIDRIQAIIYVLMQFMISFKFFNIKFWIVQLKNINSYIFKVNYKIYY